MAADGRRIKYDFRIGGSGTSSQGVAFVAHNPVSNRYLVVWNDDRDAATRGWDVYGQRLKATGTPAGEVFRISTSTDTFDEVPRGVIRNPINNQYLVLFTGGVLGGWESIHGQRVKASGRLAGEPFRINQTPLSPSEGFPAIAHNATRNQYLVAWSNSTTGADSEWSVVGQRVKATGRPAGDQFEISDATAAHPVHTPAITHGPSTDQYLVVWMGLQWNLLVRTVRGTGKPIGPSLQISDLSHTLYPAAVHNPVEQQHLVIWTAQLELPRRDADIHGQFVAE